MHPVTGDSAPRRELDVGNERLNHKSGRVLWALNAEVSDNLSSIGSECIPRIDGSLRRALSAALLFAMWIEPQWKVVADRENPAGSP